MTVFGKCCSGDTIVHDHGNTIITVNYLNMLECKAKLLYHLVSDLQLGQPYLTDTQAVPRMDTMMLLIVNSNRTLQGPIFCPPNKQHSDLQILKKIPNTALDCRI